MRSKHSAVLGLATGLALAAAPALAVDSEPANKDMEPTRTESKTDSMPTPDKGTPDLATDKPAEQTPHSDMSEREQMGKKAEPARTGAKDGDAKQYTVEKGDTLGEIAEKKLGSRDQWRVIARANDIDDPDQLRVGQKLRIPEQGQQ